MSGALAAFTAPKLDCHCVCRRFFVEGAIIDSLPQVRVRFAPSPTGSLHVGSARTALFNYLFARHCGGRFVLRIEDTDVARSEEVHEDSILYDLQWLLGGRRAGPPFQDEGPPSPPWDEGPDLPGPVALPHPVYAPYRQSERGGLYSDRAAALLASGHAYYCFCSEERLERVRQEHRAAGRMPKYDGRCRDLSQTEAEGRVRAGEPATIRLRVPDGDIVVTDIIRGAPTFSADAFGDFVLVRSNGHASFNFACAVDDHLMSITHVVRGDDHLTNTARQLLIFNALGVEPPQYAHLSLILGPDGAKLSKRHGATTVAELREAGYLPEAIVNYLALLSWSHEGREILAVDELIADFDLAGLSASPVIFDQAKLDWLNHEWIMRRKPEEHVAEVQSRILPLVREAYPGLEYSDVLRRAEAIAWPLGLALQSSLVNYAEAPEKARAILLPPEFTVEMRQRIAAAEPQLREFRRLRAEAPARRMLSQPASELLVETEDVLRQAIDLLGAYRQAGKQLGLKPAEILMPLRMALTGSEHGPDLKYVLATLERDDVLGRLDHALGASSTTDTETKGDLA